LDVVVGVAVDVDADVDVAFVAAGSASSNRAAFGFLLFRLRQQASKVGA
jgi:hypothetical protein